MMQAFTVVLERAVRAYPSAGSLRSPGPEFVEGFFLGHRAAEVDNVKDCPEGINAVAYNLGYAYASRLDVRFSDELPKKRTK